MMLPQNKKYLLSEMLIFTKYNKIDTKPEIKSGGVSISIHMLISSFLEENEDLTKLMASPW